MEVKIGPYSSDSTPREVFVQIHNYDIWNMDHTLALIIHPMLIKIKDSPGGPLVDNEDVPLELHRPLGTDDWEIDDAWHARWRYVLDEMIYAFSYILDLNDIAFADGGRADDGLRLFGKYFRHLWT